MKIGDCVGYKSPWVQYENWLEYGDDDYIGIIVDIRYFCAKPSQCQILKSDNTIATCPETILKVICKVEGIV